MAIELNSDAKKQISYQLDHYFREELDIELSEFKLESLAEFCGQSIAPIVYNFAIKDAHAYLSEKLVDMETDLYAEERKTPGK